jgi:LacI family transcriptional regulator
MSVKGVATAIPCMDFHNVQIMSLVKPVWGFAAAMRLKELASILGLSATTVSRALNGYPEVNAETRARVIAAARTHGYAPNQVAKRLATGRAMSIGHVVPLSQHQMINPHFADFIAGAGEAYSAAGYDMLISVVPEAEEAEAYRQLAAQQKVDGVIVHAPRVLDPRIDLLQRLGLPFLVHGRDSRPEDEYLWMDMNNRRAFLRATEFLLDLGHRRIALLNGIESHNFAQRRRRGFEDALARRGIAPNPALMRGEEMIESFGHRAACDMMTLPGPPTAFLTSSVLIAFGVLRALRESGREPGRDVSIVTHDDELSFIQNSGAVPVFTATRSSIRSAGKRCAEMLIARIESPAAPPGNELWEAEFLLGQSTGPALRESTDASQRLRH